jgi:hypothetical protein
MDRQEFALVHHQLKLELELFRLTGQSFQGFFERIMQKSDKSFLVVKPSGVVGDWKSDGYSADTATIYQCYAPEELTATKAANKVHEDFNGAKDRWKEKMKRWVFVWSSERALPPQVVAALAEIKDKNPLLTIEPIGREGLWDIVKALPVSDRESLLGVAPDLNDVPRTTAAEIQVLMKHLSSDRSMASAVSDLDLTAIAEKLKRNNLSAVVSKTVMPAVPVAKLVREYVTSMPDPAFSQAIADVLAAKYAELAGSGADADVIFGNLVEYVQGDRLGDLKFFWAAAGIVTHYFELCDIFER